MPSCSEFFESIDYEVLRRQRLWLYEQTGEEADGLSAFFDNLMDFVMAAGVPGASAGLLTGNDD